MKNVLPTLKLLSSAVLKVLAFKIIFHMLAIGN